MVSANPSAQSCNKMRQSAPPLLRAAHNTVFASVLTQCLPGLFRVQAPSPFPDKLMACRTDGQICVLTEQKPTELQHLSTNHVCVPSWGLQDRKQHLLHLTGPGNTCSPQSRDSPLPHGVFCFLLVLVSISVLISSDICIFHPARVTHFRARFAPVSGDCLDLTIPEKAERSQQHC